VQGTLADWCFGWIRASGPVHSSDTVRDADRICWPTAGHSSANEVSQRKPEGAKSNKKLENE
jgi:hypothetical protein